MAKIDMNKPFSENSTVEPSASTAAADTAPAAAPRQGGAARIGLWALGLGFTGFLLWAGFAPLDEGVPAKGMVAIDTKRKAVQHLTGGLIRQVLVGEGDRVTEGQPLIRLDEAAARANFETVRQRYLGLRAMEDRLLAEQQGRASIAFHQDIQDASASPQITQVLMTQQQLLISRRAALRADLQSSEEAIQGQQGLMQAYDAMTLNRKTQRALLTEELGHTQDLVKEGYAPRNRQLELERMVADSAAGLAELQGNSIRAQRSVSELQQRRIVRQQEYRKEVDLQLAEVAREVYGDAEKFSAARDDLDRILIKSPAAGQVVGLAVQTVGGVIAPGQKLMDIVPEGQVLLIEVRVAPHLIDRVHAGLSVDVRFSSFAHTPQLVVAGKVASVSADSLVDPQTGVAYYLARIGVTAEGREKLGQRQLQPGMPVEVVFLTGQRTLLTYLLSPLTKRLAASMKEE